MSVRPVVLASLAAALAVGLGAGALSRPGSGEDAVRWADGRVLHARPYHPRPGAGGAGAQATDGSAPTATLAYDPRRRGRTADRTPSPTGPDVAGEGPLPPGRAASDTQPPGADPSRPPDLPEPPETLGESPQPDEPSGVRGFDPAKPDEASENPPPTTGDAAAPPAPVPPSARVRLDTDTEREGDLAYHEPFNPSVVPLKRGLALNAVAPDGDLVLASRSMTPVPLDPRPVGPDEEAFTGTLRVDATPGVLLPLPSVSPSDRLLTFATAPASTFRVLRDAADNLFLQTDARGPLALRWSLAAPRAWFHRTLPPHRRAAAPPASLVPTLPAELARDAREVARRIGVGARDSHPAAILKLVRWFRDFRPGEPPAAVNGHAGAAARGGVYRSLALGRVGICRHRSHAFVVTAHGLGIPARYVMNDAHVFVEVWVDGEEGAGWLRVDLGGGSEGLDISGGEDKTLHAPPPDTLPRPDAYRAEQQAGASTVTGLPAKPEPQEEANPDETPEAPGGPDVAGTDAPDGAPEEAATGGPGADPTPETTGEGGTTNGPEGRPEQLPGPQRRPLPPSGRWPATSLLAQGLSAAALPRVATEVRLDPLPGASLDATRGAAVTVGGQVLSADGSPVRSGFVQALLLPPRAGPSAGAPWLLGAAALGADGRFQVTARLAPSLPMGRWELVVEFPGSATHGPSIGR